MTDALNEQLSACLDGELPTGELDLLLKRVQRDSELRAAIGRYSLIGEAMRAERPAVAPRDFAANVMAALATEPAVVARPAPRISRISPATLRYLRPAAGMAIAAGVAAIAVLTMQPVGQSDPNGAATPLVAASESAANESVLTSAGDTDPSYVVPTSTTSSAFIPATRLTNYVVAHSEYSSPLGRRSVLTGVLADDTQTEGLEGEEDRVDVSFNDKPASSQTER